MQEPSGPCEFCEIVAGRLPADVRYEDDTFIVFRNRLKWVPTMLLIVPKEHLDQRAFWLSGSFGRAAELAVRIGEADCPGGFRLVSNFGDDASQTQPHGHLHVIGGAWLGLYVDFPRKGDFWLKTYGSSQQ